MAIEKVIVIDDEPIIRRSLELQLRGKRLSVSLCSTIAEAERLIARDSFDGRPPARRGAATSASTVRISASDGGVRLRSRSHFTISPDPMVAGSRTWNSAKYASRIAAWLSVK